MKDLQSFRDRPRLGGQLDAFLQHDWARTDQLTMVYSAASLWGKIFFEGAVARAE